MSDFPASSLRALLFVSSAASMLVAAPALAADEGAIAFLGDRKFAAQLSGTRAGCVIVHPSAVAAAPVEAAVIPAIGRGPSRQACGRRKAAAKGEH